MEENDKRQICYRIISYFVILIGFDVSRLSNQELIVMINKLYELSYEKLITIENTLYTIYYEQSHEEE